MLNPTRQVVHELGRQRLAALREQFKPLVRDGMAGLLAKLGATAPARFARGALTSITFHRVLPAERLAVYPMPGLAVTPEQLEAILGELREHFSCMPLVDAFRLWQRGSAGGRPVLGITFDDGALDNFEHALPVLERLSLKASFYIPVGNVDDQKAPWHDRLGFALLRSAALIPRQLAADFDPLLAPFGCSVAHFAAAEAGDALRLAGQGVLVAKRLSDEQRTASLLALEAAVGGDQVPLWAGMMSWDQIRELQQKGHEIGSHSLTHPLLPGLTLSELHEEIASSRSRLQGATGGDVASFCYPNGSYDARCLALVREAGYECAVTTAWGLNGDGSPPYELKRCDMDYARLQNRRGEFSRARLFLRLSGLQPGLKRS